MSTEAQHQVILLHRSRPQKKHLKDYPKHIIERPGGTVENVAILKSLVVEDREVMTGQDPYSDAELGPKFRDKMLNWVEANR